LIRGANSSLLTPAGARGLVEEIPDATLVEVPGAGHNVHIERPIAVANAANAFLAPFRSPNSN
jgi:pimeloyl-ACP methyl ester carboxylesterase